MCERVRIEVAHTLACWSRFGLDDESMDVQPNKSLIQAVADSGTPNLRIIRQSQVIDVLSASFRAEDSPEAIVITLGAIRDMSLYRPLARQITNCGLISNLVHVIRVNLLGSDVLLVAAEVLWNVLELDWEGASEALGQPEVFECFHHFMDAVLGKGYRHKDKIFRNDMMVLLMYISKREENRPLFASTGLMALLLSHAVSEAHRKALHESGLMAEATGSLAEQGATATRKQGTAAPAAVALTSVQEDMEFRMLLWGTLARCCSSEECAQVAMNLDFVPGLLSVLDPQQAPPDQRAWSQEQRRKVQLEALSALFHLVQFIPQAFLDGDGCSVVLQLLSQTRSKEVQKKCLHLLQVTVRMDPEFATELGQMGAVGLLIELFVDRDNPMSSRQLCASVLAGMCNGHPDNCREFRKKDGVEAVREECVYRPDKTTDNHLFYTLCVVDCIWCAVVGTKKNEMRFLDTGGLFALLDVLEVAPLLLKRQIIGCLADLMQYRKAAKLFVQWNSQVTMKGALKILLELWQSEQEAAHSSTPEGVIRDLERPLNPRVPDALGQPGSPERPPSGGSEDSGDYSSRASIKIRHARAFADSAANAAGTQLASSPGTTRRNATATATASGKESEAKSGLAAAGKQDCRAKVYSVLSRIGFECQETLSIAERQQMELVKLYPEAVELETWTDVLEHLEQQGIKPTSADRKWVEDSIVERQERATWVQNVQRKLASERRSEELGNLNRFYDDIRGRAQLRKSSSATKEDPTSGGSTPVLGGGGNSPGGFDSD